MRLRVRGLRKFPRKVLVSKKKMIEKKFKGKEFFSSKIFWREKNRMYFHRISPPLYFPAIKNSQKPIFSH